MRRSRSDRVETVEAYVPARLEYLARLYAWLRDQLHSHPRPLVQGFSLYEVNGGFRGEATVSEERTLVVRIILGLPRPPVKRRSHNSRVRDLLYELVNITAGKEEELWVVRTPGTRTIG